jgi:1-acyl-sn-glycerol-3-phosphate acyltransferase
LPRRPGTTTFDWMRIVAVALTFLLVTPVLGAIVIVAGLLGVEDRRNGVYERLARLWARAVCAAAGVRIRLHGTENLPDPSGAGAVICSNHVSWFDVLSLAAAVRRYTFVAKRELGEIPIFGRAARAVGLIFIDRQNRKAAFASYENAAAEVRRGKSVVVCPEGTRGYDYSLRPFKKGPFVLALSAGVPIVPTVVHGAREVQRKGSMSIRGGVVNIHFLQPVPVAGYTYDQRDELVAQVWHRMAAFMKAQYGVETTNTPLGGGTTSDSPPIPSSFF